MSARVQNALLLVCAGLAAAANGSVAHAQTTASSAPLPQSDSEKPNAAPITGSWSGVPDGPEDYQVHLQSTLVYQAHPSFDALYTGQNSLHAQTEIRDTITATAFAGARLTDGLALYFDPEMSQGSGLSDVAGIAGFPNGEATHAGGATPKLYAARYFLRQVIGFGGDMEKIDSDQNQLADTEDVSRLTVTLGKFAAGDLFDANDYAHDPRNDFLNWSIWESAAWDFPADARGYTYGLALDFNQPDWALRGGWLLEPKIPNEKPLAANFVHYHGAVVELELRDEIGDQKGKLRLLGFSNRSEAGDYALSLRLMPVDPNIADTRAARTKYGFAVNFQQAVTSDLGLFTRLSWDDGRTESFAFTEIDRGLALGASLKGTDWDRADDTIGVGVAINALSSEHRDYLAAGGYGFILGDGRLNYGREHVLEAYYSALVWDPLKITADYQFIANPGYNQDRGPVSVFGIKFHVQI
jgi:high affinity Mn2+ porin